MADTGPQTGGDPEAVKRHPRLFRAARQRRNPRLRRSDITVTDERAVKRAVKAASLGNAMEWFDFGIYSYLAVTIGHVFFPPGTTRCSCSPRSPPSPSPSWYGRWAACSSGRWATGWAARRSSR
ncbi:hypothetical protein ACFQVA_27790 [Actinomadura keratinilytica]